MVEDPRSEVSLLREACGGLDAAVHGLSNLKLKFRLRTEASPPRAQTRNTNHQQPLSFSRPFPSFPHYDSVRTTRAQHSQYFDSSVTFKPPDLLKPAMADSNVNHRTSDDGGQENARSTKRRRTSGSLSSRGVANLTPEQLARKRANDREAQRAIRERTKNQIERLNNRIHELESQQPYNELQTVLRQKEAVQAENDDLRQRLASIMSIIQPTLGAQGLNGRSPFAMLVKIYREGGRVTESRSAL